MEKDVTVSVEKQEEPEVIEKTTKNMKNWHPVLTHDFSPTICGWDNFLRKWEKAESAGDKKSLLHNGFDVKLNDPSDAQKRISFYLEAAYGYKALFVSFRLSDEGNGWYNNRHHPLEEMRRNVAKKAWTILCQKFFKEFCGDDKWEYSNQPIYWHYFSNPGDCRLLGKILWFFGEEDNLPCRTPENHHDTIAVEFIVRMAKIAVTGHLDGFLRPHFTARRREFIKILLSLRRLDILVDHWQDVTEADLALVKKLALWTSDIFDPKTEYWSKFKSIDEALIATAANDRYAAQIYVQLEKILAAQKKKDEIKKLEQRAEEAREKLEQAKKS